tara:strand:- start:5597 stop:5983 length:387 start_codon:yes stop_codon:yes gene_type:complete
MKIKEQLNVDFITAFKAKEMEKKNFLGLLKSEIQNEEGRGTTTTDESVMVILRKMEKSLKQTNTTESLGELVFLEPYLPQLMGEDQIRIIIQSYKAEGLTNIGQLMGRFSKEYKGLADNKIVSKIISE